MRHRQAKGIADGPRGAGAVALLIGVLLAGCQGSQPQHTTSWMDRLRPFQGANANDAVQLDVALIERPVLDAYLSHELWDLADEQGVPLDRKAVLDDNGFRVGQVGGITPPALQALLTSERSSPAPHRIQTRSGTPKQLTVGPPAAACKVQVHENGQAEDLDLAKAEFQLVLTPTLSRDGQVGLRFAPQVRHGDPQPRARPTPDRSGLVLQSEKALRTFEGLGWEVTVPNNAYVLVGARTDKAASLGYQCFVRRDESKPVQRLLVIRVMRATPGMLQEYGGKSGADGPPPLASQAAMSAVRGKGN